MKTLTPEQTVARDARRCAFRELAQRIGQMSDLERLELAGRMATTVTVEGRSLSVHNACLLASQYPSATVIGGFQQWRKAGRMVRKGEHGFSIWAPMLRGRQTDRAELEGATPERRPGFLMVTVFDVSQTEPIDA